MGHYIGTHIARVIVPMRRLTWEVVALGLAAMAAAAFMAAPPKYVASGAVLLPTGMVRAQFSDRDPRAALSQAEAFVQSHGKVAFADRPLLSRTDFRLPSAIAAALLFFIALGLLWRRPPAVRSEREFTAVLGNSLVAARP